MIDKQKEGWGRPLGSIGVAVLREKEQRHSEDTTVVLGSATHVLYSPLFVFYHEWRPRDMTPQLEITKGITFNKAGKNKRETYDALLTTRFN